MTAQNIVDSTEKNEAASSEIKGAFSKNMFQTEETEYVDILNDEKLTKNIKEYEEINKRINYLYDQTVKGYENAAETIERVSWQYDNDNAMEKYGRLLERGQGGVEKDVQKALRYYFAAATYENRNALERIVALSKRGNEEAYEYLEKLAEIGIPEAEDALQSRSQE